MGRLIVATAILFAGTSVFAQTFGIGGGNKPANKKDEKPAPGQDKKPGFGVQAKPGSGQDKKPGFGTQSKPGFGQDAKPAPGDETSPEPGQEGEPPHGVMPAQNTDDELRIPIGVKPKPGHGELLRLKTASGESKVVRLYCDLDSHAMVVLPTGNLTVVERSKTKPTTDPFVVATPEEIKKSLKIPEIEKFKTDKGKSCLYFYNCSEGFFMHAKSIMETMQPGVEENLKALGLKLNKPEFPMIVIMMPDREAFDAYRAMPKEMAAYYNNMTNYIVMYEDPEMVEKAPEFAAKQAAYTVAHEGVHQVMSNNGSKKRLAQWRPWITEGMAEYYCPLKVNSSLIKKNKSELPERTMKWSKAGMVNDLRMFALLKMKPADGGLVKHVVEADKLDANGYAVAWGLVHYLANKKSDAFRAYLADVTTMDPLDEATAPVAGKPDPLFTKHFGDDYAKIERGLRMYLTSKTMQASYVDPIENQTTYLVKCIEKKGKVFHREVILTFSPAAAKKWKEETAEEKPNASFFTVICKSKAEANRQLELMK
jgi:hypothetical protein